jgi:hypothetical protein
MIADPENASTLDIEAQYDVEYHPRGARKHPVGERSMVNLVDKQLTSRSGSVPIQVYLQLHLVLMLRP